MNKIQFNVSQIVKSTLHWFTKTKRRKILSGILAALVIINSLAFIFFNIPKTAKAAWFDDSFAYRQKITITNSGSIETDYQTALTIDTSTLITAGKMRFDCGDIRITDANSALITLPYWVDACNTTTTKIWIKYASLPIGSTVDYVYYGNAYATSVASPGEQVFMFFDDFSGTSLDTSKWQIVNSGTGSNTVSGGRLSITSSGDWSSTSDDARIILSQSSFSSDYVVEARMIDSGNTNNQRFFGLRASTSTDSRMVVTTIDDDQAQVSTLYRTSDSGSTSYQGNDILSYQDPHTEKWSRNGTTLMAYKDSTLINTISGINNLDYVALTSTAGGTSIFDYVFMHKFITTEPTTSNSSEEKGVVPLAYWKFDEGTNKSMEQPITKNEQQINLINQTYSGASATFVPTDNSLGIIYWDSSKYPNSTVYLEAVISSNTGFSDGEAAIFSTSGVNYGALFITSANGSVVRYRSNALSLADYTDYTLRIHGGNGGGFGFTLYAARLVIVQSSPTGFTDTETQIEIGSSQNSFTNTSYTELTDPKIYKYDQTKFTPTPELTGDVSFRAALKIADSGDTVYAGLFNKTSGNLVAEVSNTGNTNWTLSKTTNVDGDVDWSTSSADDYVVNVKCVDANGGGCSGSIANAQIVLDQHDSLGKIKAVELAYQLVNTPLTDSDTGYSSTNKFDLYNPSSFGFIQNYNTHATYFEATLKTSNASDAAYAILRNNTDGSNLAASEINTNQTSYTRVRSSSDISSSMSTTTSKNMDTQIKNGSTSTTSISSSLIILQNNNMITIAIADSSRQGNNGALNNSPTWITECKFDDCLNFDGSDDYVKVADADTLDFTATDSFSIGGWFKRAAKTSGTDTIISKYLSTSGTDGGYKVYINSDGTLSFGIDDDQNSFPEDAASSTARYDDNVWHYFTATKTTNTRIDLYVDGNLVGIDTSISASGTLTNTDNLFIGIDGDGTSNPYKGPLDEIKIYPYVRSVEQIKTDYIRGAAISGSSASYGLSTNDSLQEGLIGYWKLDESASPASDSSGNSGSGTWTGGPSVTAGKFNKAISLTATSSQYITTPDTSVLSPTSAVSISAWIYPTSSIASKAIIVKDSAYRITTNASSKLVCEIYSGGAWQTAATGVTTLSTGTWELAGCTFDGKNIYTYLNGVIDGQSSVVSGINDSSSALEIGRNVSTNYFNGKIDEARVYNRALSSIEMSKLYSWAPTPVGWWKMDEGMGLTAYDYSGNSYNSSPLSGNTSWVQGVVGGGLLFDGTDDVVRIPEGTNIDLGATTDPYTIGAWFKTSTDYSGNAAIVAKNSGSGTYPYNLYLNSNEYACFAISDGSNNPTACGSTSLKDGNWHHVEGVRDVINDTIGIYVDGVFITSSNDSTTGSTSNNDDLSIGNSGTSYTANDFNGIIDDVRIYNYVRTSGQIVSDMNFGHPIPDPMIGSPVALWKFDEGRGTIAHDASINRNDLTLSAESWTSNGKFNKAWHGVGSRYLSSTVTNNNFVFSSSESFTVSSWVKSTSANNPASVEIVFEANDGDQTWTRLYFNNDGKLYFQVQYFDGDVTTTDTANTTTDIYDATWHNVVAVRDITSNKLRLYIDGRPDGTTTADTIPTGGANVYISSGGSPFNGDIDETKVYRSLMTENQAKVEYNSGSSQTLGSISTNTTGLADNSSQRSYCPPGDTTVTCTPVLEWLMDEGSGSSLNDTSGNNHIGTITSPSWDKGKIGNGLNNSSSSHVVATTTSDLQIGTVGISIFMWVKTSYSAASQTLVHTGGEDYSIPGYMLTINTSGKLKLDLYNPGDDEVYSDLGSTNVNDGGWHYLGFTISPTGIMQLYVDGLAEGDTSAFPLSSSITNSYNFFVGSMNNSTNNFIGIMDNLQVFTGARTQAQIDWVYSKGAPVVWYKFDECSGTVASNTTFSPNGILGNSGTITPGGSGNTKAGSCNSGVNTEMWNNGTTGKRNASLDFDGIDDYVVTGNIALLTPNSRSYNDLSWGAWINPATVTTSDTIIDKNQEFRLTTDVSGIGQCEIYSGGSWQSAKAVTNSAISTTTWSHILCTYDGSNIKIYRNGLLEQSTSQSALLTSTSGTALTIGRDPAPSGYFDGLIDEVKVFNYPLTAAMVKSVYNEGAVFYGPVTGSP